MSPADLWCPAWVPAGTHTHTHRRKGSDDRGRDGSSAASARDAEDWRTPQRPGQRPGAGPPLSLKKKPTLLTPISGFQPPVLAGSSFCRSKPSGVVFPYSSHRKRKHLPVVHPPHNSQGGGPFKQKSQRIPVCPQPTTAPFRSMTVTSTVPILHSSFLTILTLVCFTGKERISVLIRRRD